MSLSLTHRLEQDDDRVTVRVDIPSVVNPRSLDVSITDLCVTVNAPPHHVLNVDLSHRVSLEGYRCMFRAGVLTIVLKKQRSGLWESIEFDGREFSDEDGQEGEGVDSVEKKNDGNVSHADSSITEPQTAPAHPDAALSTGYLQKRRDSSLKRYQAYLSQKRAEEQAAAAKERRRQLEADYELRLQKKRQEEKAREEKISAIKSELLDDREADVVVKDSRTTGPEPVPQRMPTIRNTDTVYITSRFTQRRMAVPARDGRDIYIDASLGPSRAELSAAEELAAKQAGKGTSNGTTGSAGTYNDVAGDAKPQLGPYELLDKARELASRGQHSDFSSAIQAAQAALEQVPLFMDAVVLLASLLLHENRSEEVLEWTGQALLAFEGRHPLQAARRGPDGRPVSAVPERLSYSRALQSRVHGLRGAAYCQLRQYREGLVSLDTALLLAGPDACEGLRRDRELVQRIVEVL